MLVKKATITLEELEKLDSSLKAYEQFADVILNLVQENYLEPIKSSGQTFQKPSLYYKYRIKKHTVNQSLRKTIEQLQLTLNPLISLDAYYRLSQNQLDIDLPFIEKINQYLLLNNVPSLPAPAPERSQQLVGDEKWIQYKGGRRILERLGLWKHMLIVDVKEPLRFALNPQNIQRETQYHLIVENKTTYEGLLPTLLQTCFTTLIYGAGFEIVGSLSLFDKQLPLPHANHHFYYFGDVDFSGTTIWYLLQKQQPVHLALPFYEEALQNLGKPILKKQYRDEEALQEFCNQLPGELKKTCQQLLEKNNYISQEVLTASHLQNIWQQLSQSLS